MEVLNSVHVLLSLPHAGRARKNSAYEAIRSRDKHRFRNLVCSLSIGSRISPEGIIRTLLMTLLELETKLCVAVSTKTYIAELGDGLSSC